MPSMAKAVNVTPNMLIPGSPALDIPLQNAATNKANQASGGKSGKVNIGEINNIYSARGHLPQARVLESHKI
jgi:hypothetical protein